MHPRWDIALSDLAFSFYTSKNHDVAAGKCRSIPVPWRMFAWLQRPTLGTPHPQEHPIPRDTPSQEHPIPGTAFLHRALHWEILGGVKHRRCQKFAVQEGLLGQEQLQQLIPLA